MKQAIPSSFSRYSLALDAAAFLIMSALLLAIVWLTLGELARKYLELRVADAGKIELFLENRLNEIRRSFGRFADLPERDRSPALLEYFAALSDVYVLDDDLRVVEIDKASPGNRVFPGFSFSRGPVAGYLVAAGAETGFSSILRGYEDGDASVYLALRRGNRLFVGRLDLAFLRNFLVDYSQLSGTPVLLVTREGYVIASSDPALEIYTFDPRPWEGEPSVRRTFEAGGQNWIPVVSEPTLLRGHLVTFIPTGLLDIQRRALALFWAAATVALGLFLWFKNRRLQGSLLGPLSRLTAQMRDIEAGRRGADEPSEPARFREFADIDQRFRSMAHAVLIRERELADASQRAQESAQAKSTFLANMSHEIRTPLAGVIGMTELAQQHDEGGRLAGYLGKIESSARSLLGILNQILDFSKIEAGKMTLEQTAFQPAAVAADAAGLMEPAAREKGLRLVVETGLAPDEWCRGDKLRLEQVLLNLLSNAIKFTPAGSVTLIVQPVGKTRLCCEVRDTGPGLDADAQRKIFEPFAQGDSSTTRRHGGTGLGLAISKELVALMGGHLAVKSAPGRGSCFHFEIEAPKSGAPTAPAPEQKHPAARPDLSGRRVLVVDDSVVNREILEALVAATGAEVVTASDGREAVEAFRRAPCDLVFMDVSMPVMDGREAAREIRALDARVPLIALSASAFPEDMEKSQAAGLTEHLLKPLEEEQLYGLARKYLPPASATEGAAGSRVPSVPEGIDPSLYRRWLGMFAEEFGNVIAQTREDLAAGDRTVAARRLHKLSGSAGVLGAMVVSHAAREAWNLVQRDALAPEQLAALEVELSAFLTACRDK
jgi:signal transduction histidine kinase/CheY-like chemotaxis protein/HPt (histidine-containing phosphotransfer) domain-containing protein